MNALIQVARNASPYLAIELLLPGGSIIALLLWLFRRRFRKGAGKPEIGRRWIQSFGLGVPTKIKRYPPTQVRRLIKILAGPPR